jgi:hypothetical protein
MDAMDAWPGIASEALCHAEAGQRDACRKCLMSLVSGVLEVARWEYMTHVSPGVGSSAPLFTDVLAEISRTLYEVGAGDVARYRIGVLQACIAQVDRSTGSLQNAYLAGDHVAQYHDLIIIAAVLIAGVQRLDQRHAAAEE